jgi:hypothetical protein
MMMSFICYFTVSNSAVSKIETLLSTCFSSYAGCTFVCFVFIFFVFLSFQISDFAEDFDKIERNINIHIQNIQGFIRDNFI